MIETCLYITYISQHFPSLYQRVKQLKVSPVKISVIRNRPQFFAEMGRRGLWVLHIRLFSNMLVSFTEIFFPSLLKFFYYKRRDGGRIEWGKDISKNVFLAKQSQDKTKFSFVPCETMVGRFRFLCLLCSSFTTINYKRSLQSYRRSLDCLYGLPSLRYSLSCFCEIN